VPAGSAAGLICDTGALIDYGVRLLRADTVDRKVHNGLPDPILRARGGRIG
jgi:hypothetical protein